VNAAAASVSSLGYASGSPRHPPANVALEEERGNGPIGFGKDSGRKGREGRMRLPAIRRRPTTATTAQWLRRLLGPTAPQLSCEACFDELDRYVELRLAGADADAAVPGMRAHLDACRVCAEEHELLERFLAQQPGSR
jgi:hypothetical protein